MPLSEKELANGQSNQVEVDDHEHIPFRLPHLMMCKICGEKLSFNNEWFYWWTDAEREQREKYTQQWLEWLMMIRSDLKKNT